MVHNSQCRAEKLIETLYNMYWLRNSLTNTFFLEGDYYETKKLGENAIFFCIKM